MKTVKYFLIDFVVSLIISVPCCFLCDMIGEKGIVNWLDILTGLGGGSLLLLVAYILLARRDKKRRIAKIANTMVVVAITTTIVYGAFILLEWWFPNDAESAFSGNWEQWFPVSISLATFLHLQERRRVQSYKNAHDLVIAAEYHDRAKAEALCATLDEIGIKAIAVEQGSPMYINSESGAPIQVQVMGKDLQCAKMLIK